MLSIWTLGSGSEKSVAPLRGLILPLVAEATSHHSLLASKESLSACRGLAVSCETVRCGSNTVERICVSFFQAPLCLPTQGHLKSICFPQLAPERNTSCRCRLECLWCVNHRTVCNHSLFCLLNASVLCIVFRPFLCHGCTPVCMRAPSCSVTDLPLFPLRLLS